MLLKVYLYYTLFPSLRSVSCKALCRSVPLDGRCRTRLRPRRPPRSSHVTGAITSSDEPSGMPAATRGILMIGNHTRYIKSFFITAILFLALVLAVYSKIMIMYKKLALLDNYCHKSLIMIIIMWPTGSRGWGLARPMGKRGDAHWRQYNVISGLIPL